MELSMGLNQEDMEDMPMGYQRVSFIEKRKDS